MYRINDKSAAIRTVQNYLSIVGGFEAFLASTGVYDDNTRRAVYDFQAENGLVANGVVNRETLEKLYDAVSSAEIIKKTRENYSFISFPVLPGQINDQLLIINGMLLRLLNHYRLPHSLRMSRFYSSATSEAVKMIRRIYLLEEVDLIDEELFSRMINDHNSIFGGDNNLN